ncbi:MAG TPA: RidA family protein [Ktedonosporobacter sp.]|nr:RidA family protein [Ktedonosporobacter sp.]
MTSKIEQRIQELGLSLPAPWSLPQGTLTGSILVRVQAERIFVGGHVPLDSQGQVCGPFGKVGADVSLEQAQEGARRTLLAVLASLKERLGNLDRIGAWLHVSGLVNTAPTFVEYPRVMNAASQLIIDIFGETCGSHARLAIGVAGLPWGVPVEIEAELSLIGNQA